MMEVYTVKINQSLLPLMISFESFFYISLAILQKNFREFNMKLKLLLMSTTIIANASFFSHDLKYYETHLDDAKRKFEECKKEFQHALIDRDKNKIKEIKQNSECIDSEKAIKEAKRREYEAKRALEEKQRKEKEAKQKSLFEAKKKEFLEKYKNMDYLAFLKDGKQECSYFNQNALFGAMDYSLKASKCVAWKELQKEKEQTAITDMDAKYPVEKLLDYKNEVCKHASYGDTTCEFVRDVVFKQREDKVVKNYLANKDLLKKDFNACHKKFYALYMQSKYQEADKVKNTYKCYMASQAAQKLNIFNYIHPMK